MVIAPLKGGRPRARDARANADDAGDDGSRRGVGVGRDRGSTSREGRAVRRDAVPGQNTLGSCSRAASACPREGARTVREPVCRALVRRGVVLGGTNEPGTTEIVPALCASTAGDYAETIRAKFLDATRGKGLVPRLSRRARDGECVPTDGTERPPVRVRRAR